MNRTAKRGRPVWIARRPSRGLRVRTLSFKPGLVAFAAAAVLVVFSLAPAAWGATGTLVFETTSPYHHIRVLDSGGLRTLCFDDALETSMSLTDPLRGHYEYTEYFHLPWLWNTQITSVLIIGLGGGSTQRAFGHYYPQVTVESVEIDPTVVQVARNYFVFQESPRQKVHVTDGRMFLRRSTARYDLLVLDAYVQGRYGSSLPQHLATQEFFELARDHLTTNGVLAYNVIGSSRGGYRGDLVGAIYRTLGVVFPQVYVFPARTSQNVVLIATKAKGRAGLGGLRQRAAWLVQTGKVTMPGFRDRLEVLQDQPPPNASRSPVLTDDFAPVEGLAGGGAARAEPASEPKP